jgi:hypothetical protein
MTEPPLNENSCITNEYPGNPISDTLYKRKRDLINSYKIINAYKHQLDSGRASIIISRILTPSLNNWQYIGNALDGNQGTNPVKAVFVILLGALVVGYILFRFVVIRFF